MTATPVGVRGAAPDRGQVQSWSLARTRVRWWPLAVLARAGYGAVLLLRPAPAIRLATGSAPGPRERQVARVLGVRHLIQAAVTAVAPAPAVFRAGADVDTMHAASMVALAASSRAHRRVALTDMVAAASFAASGFAVSHAAPHRN